MHTQRFNSLGGGTSVLCEAVIQHNRNKTNHSWNSLYLWHLPRRETQSSPSVIKAWRCLMLLSSPSAVIACTRWMETTCWRNLWPATTSAMFEILLQDGQQKGNCLLQHIESLLRTERDGHMRRRENPSLIWGFQPKWDQRSRVLWCQGELDFCLCHA